MTTDRIMKLMEKIDSELLDYRTRIDNLVEAHNGAKSAAEQECAKMRGKWNDDYIQQYRTEQQKRSIEEAQRKMQQFREKTSQYVQLSLNQLNTEIDKLFNSPIDPDFSRKINAITLSGLTLTDSEFALLKKQAHGFAELRLLKQIAESRTRQEPGITLKDGKPETVSNDVPNAYNIGQLPDIQAVYRAFENYQSSVMFALSSYCGQNAELNDALGDGKPATLTITAGGYFRHGSYDALVKEIDKAAGLLPEMQPRELSEAERALIDVVIDPKSFEKYPLAIPNYVRKAAERSELLADYLSRDERYSQYLES